MNAKYATITPVNINWNQEIEYLLSLLERSEPKVQEAIEHLRAISQRSASAWILRGALRRRRQNRPNRARQAKRQPQ